MIYGGIALMAVPPFIEKITLLILNITIDTSLTNYDQLYGFGLTIWGSIYHIITIRLIELTNAISGIEKRATRTAVIAECREWLKENSFNREEFCDTDIYSRIRPHLSSKLVSELEKDPDHFNIILESARGGGVDNYKPNILDELVELEQKWDLI